MSGLGLTERTIGRFERTCVGVEASGERLFLSDL